LPNGSGRHANKHAAHPNCHVIRNDHASSVSSVHSKTSVPHGGRNQTRQHKENFKLRQPQLSRSNLEATRHGRQQQVAFVIAKQLGSCRIYTTRGGGEIVTSVEQTAWILGHSLHIHTTPAEDTRRAAS
jgi:hypothetical protein